MNEAFHTLNVTKLKDRLDREPPDNSDPEQGYALVNVLGEDTFEKEHIPQSINIPKGQEDDFDRRFTKDKEIIEQKTRTTVPGAADIPPGLEARMHPKPRYKAENYRPATKLADRKALITGGDSGIGRAVAVLFARGGADAAIVYLPDEEPDALDTRKADFPHQYRRLFLHGALCACASAARQFDH